MSNLNVQKEVTNRVLAAAALLNSKQGITPVMTVNLLEESTVSIDIEGAAKAYKGLVVSAKKNLKVLREIGTVLNVLYAPYAERASKDWGDYIKTTELSIMSRMDRSNAQWLATNWDEIQAFKLAKCVNSNSVGSLRKLMTAAQKAEEKKLEAERLALLEKESGVKPTAPTESEEEEEKPEKAKKLNDIELVEMVMALCKSNGLAPKNIATMLANAAKAAK